MTHAWDFEVRGLAYVARYRWTCSCGEHGQWKTVARYARSGGQRHVAAMERGK